MLSNSCCTLRIFLSNVFKLYDADDDGLPFLPVPDLELSRFFFPFFFDFFVAAVEGGLGFADNADADFFFYFVLADGDFSLW